MPLLPPRVKGPLSECSERVIVEGQLSGAQVEVFADGALVASGTAAGPRQSFALTTSLGSGQAVTATQTVGTETSLESPDPVVVQQKPPTIGPLAYRSHLHICGECLWLEGAVPGAKVEVHNGTGLRGTGESYDGNVRIHLNAPISASETLFARQDACGESGPDTPSPTPDLPGGREQGTRIPKPTVESPLRGCQRGVVVSNVFEGARVTLLRSSGFNQQACFDAPALRFSVNPGLFEGETVSARQEFPSCEIHSDDADPVVVGPAEPVPPPMIQEPLCEGATNIRLYNLLYGSKVRILLDGAEIGMAESPEEGTYDFPIPPLPAPSRHGSVVTAQQELCGIWSVESTDVDVRPLPQEVPPPQITEPLVECAAAVHVTKIHPGARVIIISAMLNAPIGEAYIYAAEGVVPVAPLLIPDDEIFAIQIGCGKESAPSDAVVVQHVEELPIPEVVPPVYDCQTAIDVAQTIPGARVEVYINGAYRGSATAGADPTSVPIIGTLQVGAQVQARQRLCDRTTRLGDPVFVEHFDGRWITIGGADQAEILAVHAALLRTNKIVYFGGDQHTESLNINGDVDHTRLFDCDTYAITPVIGLPDSADLFCSGHAQLPDGRILAAGGTHRWYPNVGDGADPHDHGASEHFTGLRDAWIFDPADNLWHQTAHLLTQRPNDPTRDLAFDIERTGGKWYPTLITLPSGKVMAVSGHPREFDTRHNNNTLERYDASSGAWEYIGPADAALIPRVAGRTLEYPRMFVLPDGDVLCVSELADGSLSVWHTGNDSNDWDSVTTPRPGYSRNPLNHTAVLLPLKPASRGYEAKVLMCGESTAWVLDPTRGGWQATVRRLIGHPDPGDVNPRRANLDAVILPTGEIFVEGGAKDINLDSTGVKVAEMFDPEDPSDTAVGTWRNLPEAQEVRNYHSVALLMPNGAVWVAGSNIDSSTGLNRRNRWIEVYEPWYFCHPRPRIGTVPSQVCVGEGFTVQTPDAANINRVVLVRCGTCTHNFNPDQRHIELVFEYIPADRLTVIAPPDTNVAPPGYYLLFVLNDQRVPSVSKFIQICP